MSMELIKIKPRRTFKNCIENENHVDVDHFLSEELDYLKNFIRTVLSGNDSSRFCKLKLQQFIQECVSYQKSELLIKELDEMFENLIPQSLRNVDNTPLPSNDHNDTDSMDLDQDNSSLNNPNDYSNLITKFELCWCNIRLALSEVIKICSPLESSSVQSSSGYTLLDKAILHFKHDMNERRGLYDNLQQGLLFLVTKYRTGDTVNFCQLHNLVEMLTCLEVFELFEERLLEMTSTYYKGVSSDYVKNYTFSKCFLKFNELIENEKMCCLYYLNPESVKSVVDVVRNELLFVNSKNLLNSENLKVLLVDGDLESLLLIHSLYLNTTFTKMLFDNIFVSSKDLCGELVSSFLNKKNYEDCHNFIGDLYNYQNKLDRLLQPIMKQSEYVNRSNAFWTSILSKDDDTIEYVTLSLAKHSDELFLYYSNKDLVYKKLKFVLHMFQYLQNKSYFEVCYRKFLSTRLLYEKILNYAHFETISLLKQECGTNYTSKLNDVVDYYKRSRDLLEEFKEYLSNLKEFSVKQGDSKVKQTKSKSKSNKEKQISEDNINALDLIDDFKFTITLVSAESWISRGVHPLPVTSSDEQFEYAEVVQKDLKTPDLNKNFIGGSDYLSHLVILQKNFKEFYLEKYKKRVVDYMPHLGSVELEASFKGYCLLLFNNYRYLNLGNLELTLGSDYNETVVKKHLSLLYKLENPLVKFYNDSINFENCNKDDYFELNLDFEYDNNVVDLRPKKEDLFKMNMNYVTSVRSFEDMIPYIEATIVRYLKQTLEASSVTIFKMFSKNPDFTLTLDQFNKVVDSLVAREFIQFNKTNKEFLQYIP